MDSNNKNNWVWVPLTHAFTEAKFRIVRNELNYSDVNRSLAKRCRHPKDSLNYVIPFGDGTTLSEIDKHDQIWFVHLVYQSFVCPQ